MPRGKAATTYEVTGIQAVLGRANGDQITSADIGDATQEERLLTSGAITPVGAKASDTSSTSGSDAETPKE